ncbi:hypothetical protein G6F62_006078 [Rhizopus arrhizus]|nr:hypothetical protein G6F23_006829 [Rhizopus arrhizus]KAG1297059.1 hypothetical protein G6F66_002934 [Rhizopus arrhizus]KAG1336969.1 hypothetical protein G6F62_006078 [Rhizopus arrhizus]KAG1382292.1 hypothetical protein G6F61_002389 [Rhizopus arrhizus]KAG1406616.1 hypothetical protein G6F60_002798 [Rhizopus arrhizus]
MLQTSLPRSHTLPRPSSSSGNSRTTRVIEELQGKLEKIEQQVEKTKKQLQTVRETKEQYERENEEYIESNKQLRSEIGEVMQILGSKQQLLDDSKKTYSANENRVKQLKDEATAARKELDDLKRRESTIEKERRTVENLREKIVQQTSLLSQSVTQHQAEFDQEMDTQKKLLASVRQEIDRLKTTDVDEDVIKARMNEQAKERMRLVKDLKRVEEEIEVNTKAFIEQVKLELFDLLNKLVDDSLIEQQVNQCTEAVNSLTIKIK